MTRQKGFKRLVRERMAKTGERYAAARRSLDRSASSAPPAVPSHGQHPESAALTTLLGLRGASSGISGNAFTEEEILGIGGGLGAGYILWQFQAHGMPYLTLGFRNRWQYPVAWVESMLGRIGVEFEMVETGGARRAAAALDELLDAGEPIVAWVDPQALGTWGWPPELSGHEGTLVVVTGRRDGRYLVDDRGARFEIDGPTLAAARGRIGSYRHRLLRLAPAGPVPADGVRAAYQAGLADQVAHLRSASDSFGLPAWRKWSRMLVDRRNAKGWPQVFGDGAGLFGALLSTVENVDGEIGLTGGHLRERYAGFLDHAAETLDNSGLADAGVAWRAAADLWEDFADAAVPASIEGGGEAIGTAEELHDAVMAGEIGRQRAARNAAALWAMRDRYAEASPMPEPEVEALLAEMSDRLIAIHAAEVAAVNATARALDH